MKKELILHIGMSKTGTTALQKKLLKNREALIDDGICYVKTGLGSGGAHHPFAKAMNGKNVDQLFSELHDEISRSSCSKFIVSSELLERRRSTAWLTLVKSLPNTSIRVCVYLRPQDDVITSMYNELVKKHACSLPFSEYILNAGRLNLLNYQEYLSNLEGIFGQENLIVRPAVSNALVDGDITADFLFHAAPTKISMQSNKSEIYNSSTSATVSHAMARINANLTEDIDHLSQYKKATRLSKILDKVIANTEQPVGGYFESLDQHEAFVANYRLSNRWVEQRYWDDKPWLSLADGMKPVQHLDNSILPEQALEEVLSIAQLKAKGNHEAQEALIAGVWSTLIRYDLL
ncbi:hypothetical protein [uncultured Umboniibacter sp.]|uniref:hypothetical protein n=1 Tax=uncultured Umboniibacter sp. TaxID=1798917 RepID=UPI002612EA5A|nr:hypothetical protein [uncultured Umboniibacter sp.]